MTQAYTHNLVPGSHRGDTGTFFMRCNRPIRGDSVDLSQISPTVLDLFDIEENYSHEALSLFRSVK